MIVFFRRYSRLKILQAFIRHHTCVFDSRSSPIIATTNGYERKIKNETFFVLSIWLGLAIKCWECRSDTDPKCADPFDNSTLSITDCKQVPELSHLPGVRPTMCRKVRQKGKFFVSSLSRITQYSN